MMVSFVYLRGPPASKPGLALPIRPPPPFYLGKIAACRTSSFGSCVAPLSGLSRGASRTFFEGRMEHGSGAVLFLTPYALLSSSSSKAPVVRGGSHIPAHQRTDERKRDFWNEQTRPNIVGQGEPLVGQCT